MDATESSQGISKAVGLTLALVAFLLPLNPSGAASQRVPISFDDYHGFEGTVEYVREVADEYPDITELIQIGESTMGRPIHVLVISNMDTGTTIDAHVRLRNMREEGIDNVPPMRSFEGKPGIWIDGGTHGNEYTGTEVTLYIIDKLVSGYGSDDAITELVDENTFYVCPMVNPDGVYNSVERGISQRQNSMEVDDDEDGRVNEDGPNDVNGDGLITTFRYPDSGGRYVQSEDDPRIMVRVGRDEETDRQRWSVVREDSDEDGDGEWGEDPMRGIDVNRNYPEGWFTDDSSQGGSGAYAASSPEAHAILEFFSTHRNILLVQSFHTSGGFTYRPFARWSDNEIHDLDLEVFDDLMAPKYAELVEGELEDTELWRHPYSDDRDRPYGFGIFIDWAYGQYGSYSMTTELWNWRRDTRGLPGFEGEDDRTAWYSALLEWEARPFDHRIFVPWEPYEHEQLGRGEVGGWVSTYVGGNALPGPTLRHVAETHWQFELWKAGLLPRLEITDASAEVLHRTSSATEARASGGEDAVTIRPGRNLGAYKVVKVSATVTNTGPLATHAMEGEELPGNRQDAIWLLGDRDRIRFLQGRAWQELGVLGGTLDMYEDGDNERKVTWLVAVEGDAPLKLVLTSQKGGTKVRALSVR